MPNNIPSDKIASVEELRRLYTATPESVTAWIYPKVMASLRVRYPGVHEGELQDAFHAASTKFGQLAEDASDIEHFLKNACRRAGWRLLTIVRKRKRELELPGTTTNVRENSDERSQYFGELRPLI